MSRLLVVFSHMHKYIKQHFQGSPKLFALSFIQFAQKRAEAAFIIKKMRDIFHVFAGQLNVPLCLYDREFSNSAMQPALPFPAQLFAWLNWSYKFV